MRQPIRSPLPAGTAGTTVVRLGAAETGSQSEPYPVSERYSLSSTPAATRPVRDSTCSATAASPGASESTRTSRWVCGSTWIDRAATDSTGPCGPYTFTSTSAMPSPSLVRYSND